MPAARGAGRRKACEASRILRDLLDLGFRVLDVLLRDRVVLLFFHFFGLRARVLARHVVVAGPGAGDQFDLETDGFGHGFSSRALSDGGVVARKLAPKRQMSRNARIFSVYSNSRKNCFSIMK